ncbi:MAG: YceI family protein [Bacteroidota bacterium]
MQQSYPFKLVLLFLGLTLGQLNAQVPTWQITDDYTIKFAGTKAEGTFSGLSGQIMFDPNQLSGSKFDVELDVSTISTGNKTKDKHARGESWFAAEKFPKIHFTSSEIVSLEVGYEAVGELELRGIKKKATISFSYFEEGDKATFEGEMKINREDYGIDGNFFAFVVGDEFDVTIQLTADRK